MARRRGRLAVKIYLYTLSCAAVAISLVFLIALLMRPDFDELHRRWRIEHGIPDSGVGGPPPPPGGDLGIRLAWQPGEPGPPGPPPFARGPVRLRGFGGPPEPPTSVFVAAGVAVLGIMLVASILFARSLVRPLQRLEATALAFGKGEQNARTGLDRNDELGAAARAFDDMADRTTTLMRSERELMANVSHELRTPLARMRVALDLAAEGDAQTAREVTTEIDRDVTELESLIDAVLTSMRLDLSASLLRREPIAPDELARRAQERARSIAPDHEVRVTAPHGMRAIDVDPVLVRRVLDNLLDNARKYSEKAGPIELRVRETATAAVFEVEDRGIGIAAADLERIFTPFFRADRSRQRGTGGVGLGLSLAHKIVTAHGGTIDVASTEGHGTVFRVELPAAAPT
jgi:two-component system, OmpR family, sensor kinase